MDTNYITKQEAVKITGLSIHTINSLIKYKKLNTIKQGKYTLVDKTRLYSLYPEKIEERTKKQDNINTILEKEREAFSLVIEQQNQQINYFKTKYDENIKLLLTSNDEMNKIKDDYKSKINKLELDYSKGIIRYKFSIAFIITIFIFILVILLNNMHVI